MHKRSPYEWGCLAYVASILSGCAGTVAPTASQIVTRDVYIPVRSPCPVDADRPAPPKTIHEEHPAMPANTAPTPKDKADVAGWIANLQGEVDASHKRERILGAKVLEDRTYIEKADRVMRACGAPDTTPKPAP